MKVTNLKYRLLVLICVLGLTGFASISGADDEPVGEFPEISLVSDSRGQRLQVGGRDFMIFGMNWDYIPIGENYMFGIWDQSDDFIKEALEREMPLLKAMGINVIRQYVGIPPRWVEYIYKTYGIFTVVNHPVGRYGYTLDGVWMPTVDYSDPRVREALKQEMGELAEQYRNVPGFLMWLLGNENNYVLNWTSPEIEALPEEERGPARARYLYSLYDEIIQVIKERDPGRLVAIANGDVQYIEVIAEECKHLDVLACNVYRGISARDLFDVVEKHLGIPVMFSEFGADAWDAKSMREDQVTQARYLLGQWEEIYEQSWGKGRAGNAIGGFIFQWSDGWWKYDQESRLDIHDTNASWPNGGYPDYVPGENNMNEEWWGITAKGYPDERGLFYVYPRAAYYALKQAFTLDPYAPTTTLETIRAHFKKIDPVVAEVDARADKASLLAESSSRVQVAGLRLEFETYNSGGYLTNIPKKGVASNTWPGFRGFDHLESFYVDFRAQPKGNVVATLSLNILGHVPENRIDEIFYENRGRPRTIIADDQPYEMEDIERVKVYQASISWDDRWFRLDGFYRTGHFHWGYEGDLFGLYRSAYYGENIDIYNAEAPVGVEVAAKKWLDGLKVAVGPQLWWGANPAIILKYQRQVSNYNITGIFQEDIEKQVSITSSIAVPLPRNRKATLALSTTKGPATIEVGGIWSGSTKIGDEFQVAERDGGSYKVLLDEVKGSDTFGAKVKITVVKGRLHWYAQAAHMGIVADGGPTEAITFTGWRLKDCGLGNQNNFLTGLAYSYGNFQFAPNFLWQKPIIGPMPPDAPPPGRLRNVLDDPFAVRANREMVAGELLITYDPTPATWFWAWDNDVRENAPFAASLGIVHRHQPTTLDAGIGILENGTPFAFPASTPARDVWEIWGRIVSRLGADSRLVVNFYGGNGEPNGDDPKLIHRYGIVGRLTRGSLALEGFLKINDWGPYDYHKDFNLTYPIQVMGDVSYSLGKPRWFGFPQTRVGVRGLWRSLDEHSPRYVPDGSGDKGNEWEISSYLHISL